MRSSVRLLPVVLVALAVLAPHADAKSRRKVPRLQAFSSCSALVDYARTNAERFGGGTGVPSRAAPISVDALPAPMPVADTSGPTPTVAPAAAAPVAAKEAAPAFSGTNVQEAGVDEPDLVKTDGKRIVALTQGQLLVIDVTGPAPVLRGRLALEGSGQQLVVRGDRALVMASVLPGAVVDGKATSRQVAPSIVAPDSRPSTRLTEVDLTDPAHPSIRRSLDVDGRLVDGRLTGGTARVVVTSGPRYVAPEAVDDAGVRTWVPTTVLRSRLSGRTIRRTVAPCDDIRRPAAFSGLDLVSVLTFDLDKGLFSVDRDAIMAGAQTIYASTDSLYVASRPYSQAVEAGTGVPDGLRTQIHRYDARANDKTTYQSTGEVPGFVLGQYSMSEYEGALRVASTSEPQWFPNGMQAGQGASQVTVLKEGAGRLNVVGQAGGLGKGERIYAVRFLGDRGYVVTFRRTDPLYTLDLSDPSNPRVRGELALLGYSAYLHPVGEDRLLGVGQDASEQGRVQGAQLSLFDVSDAAAPRRVAAASLGEGTSTEAEFDPHAFLFWDPTRLTVVPLQRYARSAQDPGFTGAVGFRVGQDSLAEVGRLQHPARDGVGVPPIGRSLVIGSRLYTLSFDGLQTANLADLVPIGYTPFN